MTFAPLADIAAAFPWFFPGVALLAMLVHQGAKSLEPWSGNLASDTTPTMAAARAALGVA